MVTIDSTLPDSFRADAVLSDEAVSEKAIAGHLLGPDHREILHFGGPTSESWSRDRRACFVEAVRATPGVKLHLVELPMTSPRIAPMKEALAALPNVTAVFCATDEIAEEVYEIAAEMGRKIPTDLSVIGYGNVNFSNRLNPPLTTVRHRPYRMGKAAAKLIIDRIEAENTLKSRIERLPVEFIPRQSTGPVAP